MRMGVTLMINRLWNNITSNITTKMEFQRDSVWKQSKNKTKDAGTDKDMMSDIDTMMLTIDHENTQNLKVFNKKLNNKYQKVPMHIVSAIATKRLFDLYTDKEIGEVLNYFGQIKRRE